MLQGFAPTGGASGAPEAPQDLTAPQAAHPRTNTAVWVLIVEDDEETRSVVGAALEDAGYLVAEAPDGVAALEVLRVSPYPLVVLLDYWMPRIDGAKVLETVAKDPDLAARHAYVVLTATPEILPPSFARLTHALSVPIVAKPFDLDALLETVARAARHLGEHRGE